MYFCDKKGSLFLFHVPLANNSQQAKYQLFCQSSLPPERYLIIFVFLTSLFLGSFSPAVYLTRKSVIGSRNYRHSSSKVIRRNRSLQPQFGRIFIDVPLRNSPPERKYYICSLSRRWRLRTKEKKFCAGNLSWLTTSTRALSVVEGRRHFGGRTSTLTAIFLKIACSFHQYKKITTKIRILDLRFC